MACGDELGKQLGKQTQLAERCRRVMVEHPFRQRSKPRQPLVMRGEKREIARKRLHGGKGQTAEGAATMLHDALCNKRLLVNSAGKERARRQRCDATSQ